MDVQARIVQVIFPSRGVQIATYLINVLGIVTSTHFSSRRLASFEKLSRSTIRQTAWSRLFVLLVLVVSWCFFVSTGILLFGVGLRQNSPACTAGFYACLLPYCAFKLAVYAFLIKRVLVVWNHRIKRGRPLRITIYLLCIGTAALYVVMIAVTIIGRITFLRVGDGECFLGLKGYSSFVVFGSDLIVSIVLTSMFLWPIMGAHLSNGPLKRLARRTLIAGIVALATSSANALAMALVRFIFCPNR
ncbi:hypothetical protein D9757_011486 [Collybiopsis confluens]|uniref:Uncharacterized protein n=1 Tax=Collybiopsis confluens TaxID=2823264 RepID=A0A8H5LWA9_9AGAR|nr:hypothetical protein D9757_011486 [Collybiopsis confluens]